MHNPGFLKLVDEARQGIAELTVDQVRDKLAAGEAFHLVDVREDAEWAADRIQGAIHIGKGVLERDVEGILPDPGAPIVLYCGGGFRSALAAQTLKKMGYTQVFSMDGGMREWRSKRYPLDLALPSK